MVGMQQALKKIDIRNIVSVDGDKESKLSIANTMDETHRGNVATLTS